MLHPRRTALGAVPLLVALVGPASAGPLPVKDGRWELRGPVIALGTHEGRDVIEVQNGTATRRDVRLEDGTIEFDVQLTRRRSFVYVTFRMENDDEHEEIYLRPHKSGLPDAVQYSPAYQGQGAWQLYHGPGATAAVAFEPGAWTRVRVVLSGRQAALYVGGAAQPALLVPRLGHEPRAGYIALRGFLPPGDAVQGPIARFANVSVQAGPVALPAAPAPKAPPPGVISAWSVSRAFVPKDGDEHGARPEAGTVAPFVRAEALPSGLVELHRFVKLPEGSRAAGAVARVTVRAARPGRYVLDLGFSDDATVFVNGQPVFRGHGRYSYDAPRRDGLISFEQARVWLPLEAGDNELAVLVTDFFGGWGLMGRLVDPAGLTVDAR